MTKPSSDESLREKIGLMTKRWFGEPVLVVEDEIVKLILQERQAWGEQEKQKRIKENKSLCGCPMCLHHTEPYERHVLEQRNTSGGSKQ